jgi:hypothetical protein
MLSKIYYIVFLRWCRRKKKKKMVMLAVDGDWGESLAPGEALLDTVLL